MESLKKRTKKGFKIITAIEIFRYCVELFLILFTARLLSPNDFGLIASALVVISLTDSFTQFGFSTSIIQFKEDSKKYINTAWTVDLIRSFILFTILFLLSDNISNYFDNQNLKLILIFLSLRPILQSLTNPYINYEIRNLEYKSYSILFLSSSILRLVIVIPLTLYFMNYWALVIGSISATFIKVITSYYLIKYKPSFEIKYIYLKKLFNFSIWLIISRIFQIFYKNIPYLILAKFVGMKEVGGFKISDQIGTSFDNIYKKYSSKVVLPSLSEINRNESNNKLIHEKNILSIISILTLFIVPSVLFTELIVLIFLGIKWIFIVPVLRFFFVLGGIYTINNFFNSLIISIGHPKVDSLIKLVAFILFISLIPFSTNIEAIIINMYSVSIFILIMNLIYTKNKLRINYFFVLKNYLKLVSPIIISLILIIYFHKFNYEGFIMYILFFLFFLFLQNLMKLESYYSLFLNLKK